MAGTTDGFIQGIRRGAWPRLMLALVATLLTLTAVLSCLAPAHADPAAPPPPTPISCIRTVAGQLLLPVRLTGAKGEKVEANFILDTGVNVCSITDAMTTRLGLKSETGIGSDGQPLLLNGTASRIAPVPLLELGAIPCGPVPCVILSAKALAGPTGQAVDGILGNNLLDALPALINLQRNEVTFFLPGPVTPDILRTVSMADATVIPLDDHHGSDMYTCMTRIECGGKSLQKALVLDIGAGETMINGSDARKLGLSTQGKPTSEVTIFTGPTRVYEGKTTAIILGAEPSAAGALTWTAPMTTRDVTVAYPRDDLPDFLPPHLGQDVLGHFLLLLDYSEKRMYVKPLSVFSIPTFVPKITVGGK